MAAVWFETGVKDAVTGNIILSSGSPHTIKAVLIDENDVTPVKTMDFANELSAGFVGTPVTINSLLSLDATTGEIRCAPINTGVLTGDPTESVLIFKDTGSNATSRLLAKLDVSVTPNGSAGFTLTFTGNKLMGVSATGFFHRTLGKLWSGAETLTGASLSVQLLSAAPTYSTEFRSGVSNTLGSPVALGSFSIADDGASLVPAASTTFTGITGTISHAMIYIVKGSAATDLPLGCLTISPSLTLSAADFTLNYPGTGAMRFSA